MDSDTLALNSMHMLHSLEEFFPIIFGPFTPYLETLQKPLTKTTNL